MSRKKSHLYKLERALSDYSQKRLTNNRAPMPPETRELIEEYYAQLDMVKRVTMSVNQSMWPGGRPPIGELSSLLEEVRKAIEIIGSPKAARSRSTPRRNKEWILLKDFAEEFDVPQSTVYRLRSELQPDEKRFEFDGRGRIEVKVKAMQLLLSRVNRRSRPSHRR